MESDALKAVVAASPDAGLVLDFDGVLAPIVADPAASRPWEGAPALLAELSTRLSLVAVVSGRPVAFLADRLPASGIRLLGSYGMEEFLDGEVLTVGSVSEWLPLVRSATVELEALFAGVPAIQVEPKSVSVAVHWRNAHDRAMAGEKVAAVLDDLSGRTGLSVKRGKFVLELEPPVSIDKGVVLRTLAAEAGVECVVYVGDDLGDAPAFKAAVEAGGHAILVDHGAETPDELRASTTEQVDGVDGFERWLRELGRQLENASRSSGPGRH